MNKEKFYDKEVELHYVKYENETINFCGRCKYNDDCKVRAKCIQIIYSRELSHSFPFPNARNYFDPIEGNFNEYHRVKKIVFNFSKGISKG